jgi:hypothetical protein
MAHPAQRIAEIVAEGIEHGQAALIAVALLRGLDAAKLQSGMALRLVRLNTAADVFVGQQLDMRIELLGEIAVGLSAIEAAEQALPRATQCANHAVNPFALASDCPYAR